MKAFVFAGGSIRPEGIFEKKEEGDIVIAADSGYLNAKKLGFSPDLLVGDFDSLGKANLPDGVERLELPAEKDVTDTQVAIEAAIEKGADQIVIIGGLDGRLDHTLSNLAILRMLSKRNIYATASDGQNRARYIRSGSIIIARSAFRYLSVLADDDVVKGVDIEGCKYPLKNAKIFREHQFAVSNEIVGNCALIAVKKGGIFIIESSDK